MRGAMKPWLLWAALVAVSVPDTARADGYVTPWVGLNVASATDPGRTALGVTAGYMAAGALGFEADVGYSPDLLGSTNPMTDSAAITVLGNFILGVPFGGTHGAGVRPFLSGGFGLTRARIESVRIINVSESINGFGYDVGFGMMGFFNQHVGLRGDVRYLHMLDDTSEGAPLGIELGRLHYWRVSAGLTFR